MPDLLLFFKASVFSVSVSAVTVLVLTFFIGQATPDAANNRSSSLRMVLSFLAGAVTGYGVLGFHWQWPPGNALARFLEIILPAIVLIELVASIQQLPRAVAWFLRAMVAAVCGRILWHESVYLIADTWFGLTLQTASVLVACLLGMMSVWLILFRLTESPVAEILPIGLAMCIQTAGLAIMLAGYIRGGAAAIPLSPSLAAPVLTLLVMRRQGDIRGLLGVGIISLFSLLFIGRYFGAISTVHAVVIFVAPCLAAVSLLPIVRRGKPAVARLLCLTLISVPLLIVLMQAKSQFDQRMAPLISGIPQRTPAIALRGLPVDGLGAIEVDLSSDSEHVRVSCTGRGCRAV